MREHVRVIIPSPINARINSFVVYTRLPPSHIRVYLLKKTRIGEIEAASMCTTVDSRVQNTIGRLQKVIGIDSR